MPPTRIDSYHFSPDTAEFLRLLHEHGVRYLIIGGEAVIFHGHVRLTGDVGFFFDGSGENARRLFNALAQFWTGAIPGIAASEELSREGLILQFGRPPNRIDLVNRIDGVAFADAWATKTEARLAGQVGEIPIYYLGLDALIRNKAAVGRPRDLEDLEYLKRAARPKRADR